jgi:hypothetical protein
MFTGRLLGFFEILIIRHTSRRGGGGTFISRLPSSQFFLLRDEQTPHSDCYSDNRHNGSWRMWREQARSCAAVTRGYAGSADGDISSVVDASADR